MSEHITVPPVFGWHSQTEQQQYAEGDPTDPPAPDPAPANEPPKPGPPAPPEPIEGSNDGGQTFSKEYVERLRQEAARKRTDDKAEIQRQIDEALANGQKAWATKLGKDLGILEADKEKTPDAIIAELRAERDTFKTERDQFAQERSARKERDAIDGASKSHGGDASLIRAVLRSEELLKSIDPTADDYEAQVATVVKDQIEKNPKLREVQVAGRSGGEAPPQGTPNPGGPKSIDDLIKERRKRRGE